MVSLSNIWHSTINEYIWYMNLIIKRIYLYYSPFIYKIVTPQERCFAKCFQTNMMFVKKFWHFWRVIFYTWWFFWWKFQTFHTSSEQATHLKNCLWSKFWLQTQRVSLTISSCTDNFELSDKVWILQGSLSLNFCYTEFASFGQLH